MSSRPPVRTFKPRRRPLTSERSALLERLAPVWCVDEVGPPLNAPAIFGRTAPLVFDIGIGFGDTLTTMSAAEPSVDLIGCDVHTPGIASTLARIEDLRLSNVRLVHGDALLFCGRLAEESLAGIRIYFPDPWPKARHRHRRLVSEEHIARLVGHLAPGGFLHLATDIDDYASQARRVCEAHPALTGGVIDRPDWRPVTRYERKGLAAGHTVTDMLWHKESGVGS